MPGTPEEQEQENSQYGASKKIYSMMCTWSVRHTRGGEKLSQSYLACLPLGPKDNLGPEIEIEEEGGRLGQDAQNSAQFCPRFPPKRDG